jgi:hypothetical protein
MRRAAAAVLGALALAALTGCDEEQSAVVAQASQEEQKRPGTDEEKRRRLKAQLGGGKAEGDAVAAAAAPADVGSGRELFDGAAKKEGDPAGPVAAGAGGKTFDPSGYTDPARRDTLTINEPPPPHGSEAGRKKGGVQQASHRLDAQGNLGGHGHADGHGAQDPGVAPPLVGSGQCPSDMVPVGSFCIDRFEGYLVGPDGAASSPYERPEPGKKYRAANAEKKVPQGYISGVEAAEACGNAGKRLCTLAEWLKACQGPSGTTYPYSNTYEPRRCNEHDRDPEYSATILRVFDLHRDRPYNSFEKMNDPRINQQPNGLLPSGEKSQCKNDYGVFDMVGNLHEWIDDPAGTFKGGYYNDTTINGDGCHYTTTFHEKSYHDYSTGFRCCKPL